MLAVTKSLKKQYIEKNTTINNEIKVTLFKYFLLIGNEIREIRTNDNINNNDDILYTLVPFCKAIYILSVPTKIQIQLIYCKNLIIDFLKDLNLIIIFLNT